VKASKKASPGPRVVAKSHLGAANRDFFGADSQWKPAAPISEAARKRAIEALIFRRPLGMV